MVLLMCHGVVIEIIIQSCDVCQRTKLSGPGYGQLPPRDALITPWFEVAVDLIGPWNVTISSRVFTFQALTCIDTVTDRKSTRLNSSHRNTSRMPSSA